MVTADGKLSAQYEYTIVVTDDGCEILTPWHLYMQEPRPPDDVQPSSREL